MMIVTLIFSNLFFSKKSCDTAKLLIPHILYTTIKTQLPNPKNLQTGQLLSVDMNITIFCCILPICTLFALLFLPTGGKYNRSLKSLYLKLLFKTMTFINPLGQTYTVLVSLDQLPTYESVSCSVFKTLPLYFCRNPLEFRPSYT